MPTSETAEARSQLDVAREELDVRLPDTAEAVDQDQEWCDLSVDGRTRRIRFHDYDEIYAVPGLYERLFYDELECSSPETVCGLLADAIDEQVPSPDELRVLDVGAGNGMVGEELAGMGADLIVGVDIIESASAATERDRPGVYDDYMVIDLTDPPAAAQELLERRRFNSLVSVAALGFGDIPPRAFAGAYDLVEDDGWVAFNIKEDFLGADDATGFARLVDGMLDDGTLDLVADQGYVHRLSVTGDPLRYVAVVGQKRADTLSDTLAAAEAAA